MQRPARGTRETTLALSVGLGLRAGELAGLNCADVHETDMWVRKIVHLKAAFAKGGRSSTCSYPRPRYGACWRSKVSGMFLRSANFRP